jgi:hypothetical protein
MVKIEKGVVKMGLLYFLLIGLFVYDETKGEIPLTTASGFSKI